MVRIGINGFGRIGRLLLRHALSKCKEEKGTIQVSKIVMINDPHITPECMKYLLKHDSVYGRFKSEISNIGNCLLIDGQRIETSAESNPDKIPWSKTCVDYVVETCAENTSCEKAGGHLKKGGIKRVILTKPSNAPVFIMGVNHDCYTLDMKIVSAGSPTLNCIVSLLRVLHDNFKILKSSSFALHPLHCTSDTAIDSSCGKHSFRSGRSVFNIVPIRCDASGDFIGRIMPELDNVAYATAVRVPVLGVGAVELNATFGKEASYDIVLNRIKDACESYMKGIVRFTNEEVVSSDILGDTNSCVVDGKLGFSFSKCNAKIFAWYDAEYAFARRVLDMVNYLWSREGCKS